MGNEGKRIALLIDAENASAQKIGGILAKLTPFGTIAEGRAYGNWTSGHLKPWAKRLSEHSISPIQLSPLCPGKNAADIALVVDAMDLLHTRSFDAFAIVTSDADFTRLVRRIVTDGVNVYGFGERKTPQPFVRSCSRFFHVEELIQASPKPGALLLVADRRTLRANTRLVSMLRKAVSAAAGDDGWSHLSQVRNQIGDRATFDPVTLGYRKLGDLIEASGLFDVRRLDTVVHVRDRRKRSLTA